MLFFLKLASTVFFSFNEYGFTNTSTVFSPDFYERGLYGQLVANAVELVWYRLLIYV